MAGMLNLPSKAPLLFAVAGTQLIIAGLNISVRHAVDVLTFDRNLQTIKGCLQSASVRAIQSSNSRLERPSSEENAAE